MKDLLKYLDSNKIRYRSVASCFIEIDSKMYLLLRPNKDDKIFNEDFHLITVDPNNDFDNYIFEFGGKWYWTPRDTEKEPQLNLVKYLGEVNHQFVDIQFPFLGVRGKYEMLNGSRLYTDWVKKAKFLGVNVLGICEKNTLAGILSFQTVCKQKEIKPILGATFTINQNDYRYDTKFYVKNETGYRHLLLINKEINVINHGYIFEKDVIKYLDGLVVVLDPKSLKFEKIPNCFKSAYYQFDSVEYEQDTRDKEYLLNLKKYKESDLEPIAIMDAFYLDKEDFEIKGQLNQISGVREYKAYNQYFKDIEDYYNEISVLFKDDDLSLFLERIVSNLYKVIDSCNFEIDTTQRHLPVYELSEEEKKLYTDKYDLFWSLIEKGVSERVPKGKEDEYLDRIEREFKVIEKGDVLDYFLILHDITSWARRHDILVGIGRGSAGGSAISYMLKLTNLDPIKLGLLFERFLNEGRVKVSLPDLDIDFAASRRDEVKRYMEQRYGIDQVCSIGTFTTLQLKAALREFCRLENIPVEDINYFSKLLDIETGNLVDIFKMASKNLRLKKFIKDYPQIINSIDLVLGQPKAGSVHPCATLILPKEKNIYDWIPVKMIEFGKEKQNILVAEWEGGELDSAGFLKEDILGIQQLDKFQTIIDLVKEHIGDEIDIYSIPLDDKEVYSRFQRKLNSDVFHFGAVGLSQYLKELQPENIEDLIVAISLYRPGPIESGFHKKYLELKEGKIEPEYGYDLEEITRSTYGLYVYQEQIMQVYQKLGGFTLVEADDIRKAMGKSKPELIKSYGDQFEANAIKIGCPEGEAKIIRKELEGFGNYSFNRSHGAAYAITGYICQWLKVHYPVYFWISAFKYLSEDKDIPTYISEIYKLGDVILAPPNINLSGFEANVDYEKNTIYWKLSSIMQCAEMAVGQIVKLREKGDYFSFEEFLSRNIFTSSKVNKSVIENLVLSGVFDEIEGIRDIRSRKDLIEKYRLLYKVKPDVEKDWFLLSKDRFEYTWWWLIQQKRLSGLAFFNYKELTNQFLDKFEGRYVDVVEFFDKDFEKITAKIGGYVIEIDERESKRGRYANVTLESNYEFIKVKFWSEEWELFKDIVIDSKKSIMLIGGQIMYDSWEKCNTLVVTKDTEIIILD
jgi:DNA polymerase-3 subunit alpha